LIGMFFAVDEFGNEALERFKHEDVLQGRRFRRDLNPTFISRRKAGRSRLGSAGLGSSRIGSSRIGPPATRPYWMALPLR
jgi:hypothetical protein